MYFPIGWPKCLDFSKEDDVDIKTVFCNRDRSFFGILTSDSISVWYSKPCVQLVTLKRSVNSVENLGSNNIAEWKLDSSMIVVSTLKNHLIFFKVEMKNTRDSRLYEQHDSRVNSLKRGSVELFTSESIPVVVVSQLFTLELTSGVNCLVCIRDELMVGTLDGSLKRIRWDGTVNTDYFLRLPRIPFASDQQLSKGVPMNDSSISVIDIDYSPLLGGFAVVFSDGRAAFLTGPSLLFEPNQVQGLWAHEVKNAVCTSINHKYRLIAYGLKNAQGIVFGIDEITGGLQVSHQLILSAKHFPDVENAAGSVSCLAWSPDGSTIALAWDKGGISLWSVFGCLLMCTLNWLSGFDVPHRHFNVRSLEWSVEGYSLWMVTDHSNKSECDNQHYENVMQLQFVKSALCVNPCMSSQSRVFLQGDDRVYVNAGNAVIHSINSSKCLDTFSHNFNGRGNLLGNKKWLIVQVPYSYIRGNWPIRYSCIDKDGDLLAVAGTTGLAHYSLSLKRWKLFGNESQERDFVVTGGMLWWKKNVVVGCYNFVDNRDEIRLYTHSTKLDNSFVKVIKIWNQVLLMSSNEDRLCVYSADSQISVYNLQHVSGKHHTDHNVQVVKEQVIDISALSVHPACVVSVSLTPLRSDSVRTPGNDLKDLSLLINVCGKLMMVQRDRNSTSTIPPQSNGADHPKYTNPVILASGVENTWVSSYVCSNKLHLTEALWISCGAHGMRVWLPLLPSDGEKMHNFMSKRIMLPLQIPICPLAVLFEDAVILGAENDFVMYNEDSNSPDCPSLPFSVVNRTSQVYLHHIFRQLLKRNLGLHAWEIARSCNSLPYFPHSLELLLHEVLEEEATSSEPIPDALLPRVVDFIREFPVFLQTVVQCARKIEIALWHHLFTTVGNPRKLFQECLDRRKLETAASYLIILQNLESSNSSRQHATLLLDAALDNHKWELAKDLVRFLRAIDPHDLESSPRTPSVTPLCNATKYSNSYSSISASPASANVEDVSSMLGLMQVINRNRAPSTGSSTSAVKLSSPQGSADSVSAVNQAFNKQLHGNITRSVSDPRVITKRRQLSGRDGMEDCFLDDILICHARKLLSSGRIYDIGRFSGHLDFHLVSFFKQERFKSARIDDFVSAVKKLHVEFKWPYPISQHPVSYYNSIKLTPSSSRKSSGSLTCNENIGDKIRELRVDVSSRVKDTDYKIGDSGYVSNSTIDNKVDGHRVSNDLLVGAYASQTLDAYLTPLAKEDNESMLALDVSDESSLWSDDPVIDNDESETWSSLTLGRDLEVMSQELASKGPSQSEVQLRYMLQMMHEAGCLEWSLVIGVVLRDAMAIVRAINCARQPDYPSEAIIRLRDGLLSLGQWADAECHGYKPFMHALNNQAQVLNRSLNSTPRILKLQSQSSSSSSIETTVQLNNLETNDVSIPTKLGSQQSLNSNESLTTIVNDHGTSSATDFDDSGNAVDDESEDVFNDLVKTAGKDANKDESCVLS